MNRIIITLCLLAALCFTQLSFAEEMLAAPKVTSQSGLYIGGSVGYGKNDIRGVLRNDGFVWLLDAGYKISKMVALEVGFLNFARIKSLIDTSSCSNGVYLAIKTMIPFGDSVDAFIKIGVLETNSPLVIGIPIGDRHRVTAITGIGAGYTIIPNIAVSAETLITIKSGSFPTTFNFLAGASYILPL